MLNKKDDLNLTQNNGLAAAETPPLSREHFTQKQVCENSQENQVEKLVKKIDTAESLVVEAAIAIVINGIHYAVLMASPNQLDELALGFLFSEGLISQKSDLIDWEITPIVDLTVLADTISSSTEFDENSELTLAHLSDYDIYLVDLTLNQRCHQRIQSQRRMLSGRTGCGMCGMTGIYQALPKLQPITKTVPKPSLETLLTIRSAINDAQFTHQLTGAVHAAATIYEGKLFLFEDVGRHNALDKLIGWQLKMGVTLDYVVMTSRLSIELVQKSIRADIPWLIGMSAPTSTAVLVAERYGLGLAGFLRGNRVTFYSNQ